MIARAGDLFEINLCEAKERTFEGRILAVSSRHRIKCIWTINDTTYYAVRDPSDNQNVFMVPKDITVLIGPSEVVMTVDRSVEAKGKNENLIIIPPNTKLTVLDWGYSDETALLASGSPYYFYVIVPGEHLVPATSTPVHACHCPKENFYFNGIGCTCGGV